VIKSLTTCDTITPASTDGCLFSAVFYIRRYYQVFILNSYLQLVRGTEICLYVSCLLEHQISAFYSNLLLLESVYCELSNGITFRCDTFYYIAKIIILHRNSIRQPLPAGVIRTADSVAREFRSSQQVFWYVRADLVFARCQLRPRIVQCNSRQSFFARFAFFQPKS
jgi:hypothetical protein